LPSDRCSSESNEITDPFVEARVARIERQSARLA
jgi:hypothetical protein